MTPYHRSYPAMLLRGFLYLIIASANGCFDTQIAGTSTNTGNTISAQALLSDGSPASGARVAVRQVGYIPAGVPGSPIGAFSKEATADSEGNFDIRVPSGMRFFLTVYSGGMEGEALWREDVAAPFPMDNKTVAKDTLILERVGGVSGRLLMIPGDSIWLGFPGTSRFTRPQADGYFNLDSLPPGNHVLRIIRSNTDRPRSLDVDGWTSLSGATVSLDTLALPSDTAIHSLSVPACLDQADSLLFSPKPAGHADPQRVFRAVMGASPAQWVELDACLGTWTSKATLPNSVSGNPELLAGPAGDYLMIPDSNRILRLDASGAQPVPTYPESLALAYFHDQRFYGFFHLDSSLRSFPDEAAWLGKRFDVSYPRPAVFQRFAVGNGAIYYLIPDGVGVAIERFDFSTASFHAPVSLPDFHGACVGMTVVRNGEVWLLSDSGELYRVDGVSGKVLSKSRVIMTDSLRGLAGGN